MSYSHQNIDAWISIEGGASLIAAIDPLVTGMLNLRPGYQPIMPVAIYAQIFTAPTVAAAVVAFKFRPTLASATGEITIGTLTLPIAQGIGTIVYKTVDNVKCLPGGEIVVQVVTGTGGAGQARFGLIYAPNWDSPGNNAKMTRSA